MFHSTECRAAFEVYDTTGGGEIDCVWLGSLLRALDVTVTDETVTKAGGTKKAGRYHCNRYFVKKK